MEKTNACLKNNELTAVLNTHFQGKLNLARVKLISLFVCSLCKVQTVTFDKLANVFDARARSGSSLGRIQRFIADYALDGDLIAKLVFSLLPEQGKVKLTIRPYPTGSSGERTLTYSCWVWYTKGWPFRCSSPCWTREGTPTAKNG